jgi:hypothetical protein
LILKFRIGSNIFGVTQLKVVKKCRGFSMLYLLFADDVELMAESELELLHVLNVFAEVVSAYSQESSVKNTEVCVVQPRDTRCHVEELYRMQAGADVTNKKIGTILVYGKPLEVVSEFKYLGSAETNSQTHSMRLEFGCNVLDKLMLDLNST